jgi:hypothetical protein
MKKHGSKEVGGSNPPYLAQAYTIAASVTLRDTNYNMEQACNGITLTGANMQKTFNPVNFCFAWTDDNWYTWDRQEAHNQARQARDAEAKRLKAQGKRVSKFSMPNQLISRGGIGSGKPHIQLVATCYGVECD